MSIQTVIVDDHPLICAGMKELLNRTSGFSCSASFDNISDAKTYLRSHSVDLVICDLQFPDGISIPFIAHVASSSTRVVMVSAHQSEIFGPLCLAVGASDFVSKDIAPTELIQVLSDAMTDTRDNKETPPEPETSELPLKSPSPGSRQLLTPREWEVLAVIGQGFSTRESASKLFVSEKTVESHRSSIKRKLQIQSKDRLISVAAQWLGMAASV